MKKKLNFLLPVLLIAAGAFVSGYAFKWSIDILGIALMLGGAGLATFFVVKKKDNKKLWIASLVCAWAGVVLLTVAGLVQFKGTVILALAGALLIGAYWRIEVKRE